MARSLTNSWVQYARIVPPTSQNQARIEEDLRYSLERVGLDQDKETLRHTGEMVIRNYDPCISCATHFLKLNLRGIGS
jgi:coenzyme F420-reducing hydrogenase alpha subunit